MKNSVGPSARCSFVLCLLTSVALGIGCKKESAEGEAPATEAAQPAAGQPAAAKPAAGAAPAATGGLSAARGVRAAMEKKDYKGAVALLASARSSVTAKTAQEYTDLVDEVKMNLIETAPSDPKAAQALGALRALTGGR